MCVKNRVHLNSFEEFEKRARCAREEKNKKKGRCTRARARARAPRATSRKTVPRGTNLSLLSTTARGASSWSGGSAEMPWARSRVRGFVGVSGGAALKGRILRNLSRWLRNSWISASRQQTTVSSSAIRSSLIRSSSWSSLRGVPIVAITAPPPAPMWSGTWVICVVVAVVATMPMPPSTAAAPSVGSCVDAPATATAAPAAAAAATTSSSSSARGCCDDEKHSESKHTRIDTQASPIGTRYFVPSSIQLVLVHERGEAIRRASCPGPDEDVVGRYYRANSRDTRLPKSGGPTSSTASATSRVPLVPCLSVERETERLRRVGEKRMEREKGREKETGNDGWTERDFELEREAKLFVRRATARHL